MKIKRFMTGVLALMLSVGMVSGCGSKVTTAEITRKSNDKVLEISRYVDESFADSELDYEEYRALINLVSDSTLDVGMTGVGTMTMSKDGISVAASGDFIADFSLQLDADELEFGFDVEVGYGYDLLGTKENQIVNVGLYFVKENDGYYFYTKLDDNTIEKEYAGNLEELFATPSDVSEYVEQLNGETFENWVKTIIDNPYKDKMILQKETVYYDGKECYVIDFDITSEMIKEILESDEEYTKYLEESGITLEDVLAEEIDKGLTMNDVLNSMNFKCRYYYTTDDYSFVYFEMDMKDMAYSLVKKIADAAVADEDYYVTVDITDFKIFCKYKNEAVDIDMSTY